ncbi:hypothetical protein [Mesobacillus harenae]|uniref:hypothetical protein n=1 Tax=Mesobacillus harenae TaxID=2213203 RepID=UPI001580CFC6|nr:hypothetical protein [Mesobacillus harenae]
MLLFNRNKLEVYIGSPQEEVVESFAKAFKTIGITFEKSLKPPNVMYDARKEQVEFRSTGISFTFLQVTSDPIHRFFMSLISPGSLQASITLLSVNYTPETKSKVKTILQTFDQSAAYHPWKIRTHPRFQYAILLELLNKRKWKAFAAK